VLTVAFELAGQPFVALNGGPHFALTPAFSVLVSCRTQREVDRLWETLSRGGEKSRCGWLIDRFGLSWQIVPTRLMELLADRDRERAERVMAAMLKMRKIVVADLERAAARS
jgi:predicted 3-demethylubiquinone-9 3-methyltransferase (glyoxalase superfamily)